MRMITEVWILTLITGVPPLALLVAVMWDIIKYRSYDFSHVAILQLLTIWGIIPGMFIFKLLEIYKVWPY